MSQRLIVRCQHCDLNQFVRATCVRCNMRLLQPREPPPVAAEPDDLELGDQLPTCSELEMRLIREALRRTGSPTLAAKLIGIGKTTLYRKLKECRDGEAFQEATCNAR